MNYSLINNYLYLFTYKNISYFYYTAIKYNFN